MILKKTYLLLTLIGGANFLIAPNIVSAATVLFDSLIARVGQEAVTLNDITRFRSVEDIMLCAGLRNKHHDGEKLQITLSRYIEEELFYLDSRVKKINASGSLSKVVEKIRGKKDCREDWNELGQLYGKAWETESRPREGEGMLVRELEKRLVIDRYMRTENIGDRAEWVREAKIRYPVKLYLD